MSTCATVSPVIPLTRSVIRRRAWATTSRIDAGHCTDIDTLTMTTSPSTRADVRAGVSSVAEPSACPNSVRGAPVARSISATACAATFSTTRSSMRSRPRRRLRQRRVVAVRDVIAHRVRGGGDAHERLRAVPPR